MLVAACRDFLMLLRAVLPLSRFKLVPGPLVPIGGQLVIMLQMFLFFNFFDSLDGLFFFPLLLCNVGAQHGQEVHASLGDHGK